MALLFNTRRAQNIIQYSSPATAILRNVSAFQASMYGRYEGLDAQGKTASKSVESAVLRGACWGMEAGGWASFPLSLSFAVRAKMVLPQLGAPRGHGSVLKFYVYDGILEVVKQFVTAPLLHKAEKLKDAPYGAGAAVQLLAFAVQAATLWFTEVPRLAFISIFIASSIAGGTLGALGALLYYGAAKGLTAWHCGNEVSNPPVLRPCFEDSDSD